MKRNFLKKIPMILLTLIPYVFIGSVFLYASMLDSGNQDMLPLPIFLLLAFGGLIILLVPMALYAWLLPKFQFEPEEIFFWNMTMKLFHIPLYLAIPVAFILFSIWGILIGAIISVFDYALLLATSMYGFSGLLQSYKRGHFSKIAFFLCGIAQFIFGWDIVSAFYCFIKVKAVKKV